MRRDDEPYAFEAMDLSVAYDYAADILTINGVRISVGFVRSFFAGEIKEVHASIERRGDELRFTALPCGRRVARLRAAAEEYCQSLRDREHGGVAAGALADQVLAAFGIDWRKAPEVKP